MFSLVLVISKRAAVICLDFDFGCINLYTPASRTFFFLVNIRRSASVLQCVDAYTSDGKESDFGCGARYSAEPGALFAFTSMLKPLIIVCISFY